MIRKFGRTLGDAVVENVGRAIGRAQERKSLPVDLLESDDAFLAVFDAPGTTSSDVQVRLHDGTVEVRIDRFRDFYEDFEMRYPGRGLSLDGSVDLPEDAAVDAEAATAVLQDNGTLEVHVPKAGAAMSVEDAADAEDADSTTDQTVDADEAGDDETAGGHADADETADSDETADTDGTDAADESADTDADETAGADA